MQTSCSIARLTFLISLFHVVLVICCIVFQKLEYKQTERTWFRNYTNVIDDIRKDHQINSSEKLIARLRILFYEEEQEKIREKFNRLENAYMFVLASFTALGNSGLRPSSWQGKLFYSFIIPFGFALYIYIIISFAYHIRDFMVVCIAKIENKKTIDIRFLSTKILVISLILCLFIAQIGGAISASNGDSYFNGVYIAMDTMTFTGNESLVKNQTQLALLFLLSFYYMLLHSCILVFLCDLQQIWNEITSSWSEAKSTCFYQDSYFSPEHNYKYKLLSSFDSPGSTSSPSDNEEENDVCYPQLWGFQYDYEPRVINEPLMFGQTERKESRFSEIFNAQKDLFEPIIETPENQEEDLSDASSYKSSNDYFIMGSSKLQNCVKKLDEVQANENAEVRE